MKEQINTKLLKTTVYCKPFVKWLGGKTQLLEELEARLPQGFDSTWTYVEPFLGGGAFMFHLLSKYPGLKVVANDLNVRLVATFVSVRDNVGGVIDELWKLDQKYSSLQTREEQNEYYYNIRTKFNEAKPDRTGVFAAYFIFLNKTCFNGLYRENSKGEFNAPHGRTAVKKLKICDTATLRNCSKYLQNVIFVCKDYQELKPANYSSKTLWYFDPPYRPISKTSAFTAYTKSGFNDDNQRDLKDFCDDINNTGQLFMLSDSDTQDGFFDELYQNYTIDRVKGARSVNCKGNLRGPVSELIIKNF